MWAIIGWAVLLPAIAFYGFIALGKLLTGLEMLGGRAKHRPGDEPEYGDPPDSMS
jgi:hypothetical protein